MNREYIQRVCEAWDVAYFPIEDLAEDDEAGRTVGKWAIAWELQCQMAMHRISVTMYRRNEEWLARLWEEETLREEKRYATKACEAMIEVAGAFKGLYE